MSALLNTNPQTLQPVFWSEQSVSKPFFLTLAGVLILAAASQLSIPLQPVPLTFQSATVILLAMALGPRYAVAIVSTYLFVGMCGLPIFSNFSGGILKFFSPVGGYLMGFLPAAALAGFLAERGCAKNIFMSFIAATLSTSIIFLSGVLFLSRLIGLKAAISTGFMPFIISEPLKLLAVAVIVPRFWKNPVR